MEPVELSLTQVSFDSRDSLFEKSVNSFDNLVSYDCDLSLDTTQNHKTSPVKCRAITGNSYTTG